MIVHNNMASFYNKKYKEGQLRFIITAVASKKVMTERYNVAVNSKEFLPIELLLPEEKEKLRSECLATGLKFTNRQMNEACRILYILKQI